MMAIKIVGYADRLSVQPGESIKFMVSCQASSYRADIVRMIHDDPNPQGPGFKEELVQTPMSGEYSGRKQPIRKGSYVIVLALQARFRSRQNQPLSAKILAAMRNQFGGHAVRTV